MTAKQPTEKGNLNVKTIAAKFGGTSLADADQIKKVLAIVQSDPDLWHIVVSAPGKRHPDDQKITDLLYAWYCNREWSMPTDYLRDIIKSRFAEIVRDLGIEFDLDTEFNEIERQFASGASEDYIASRGEYLMGKIVAIAIGYKFVDPAT